MKDFAEKVADAAVLSLFIGAVVIVVAICLWAFFATPISQYEVSLGDGTKATCIIGSVRGGGGITCLPHGPAGKDSEVQDDSK
jgi:hypothetical protein